MASSNPPTEVESKPSEPNTGSPSDSKKPTPASRTPARQGPEPKESPRLAEMSVGQRATIKTVLDYYKNNDPASLGYLGAGIVTWQQFGDVWGVRHGGLTEIGRVVLTNLPATAFVERTVIELVNRAPWASAETVYELLMRLVAGQALLNSLGTTK